MHSSSVDGILRMRTAAHIVLLSSLLLAGISSADDENDRRHKYGNGKNKDGAAYIGDQETKKKLTPNMVGHYTQATMHFAMGNIPMGVMEQTKGNMLKQQIDENKKTADKNRDSEKLLFDYKDTKVELPTDPRVHTVDKSRLSMKETSIGGSSQSLAISSSASGAGSSGGSSSAPVVSSEPTPPAGTQIAQMGTTSAQDSTSSAAESSGALPGASSERPALASSNSSSAASTADSASVKSDWKQDLDVVSKPGGEIGSGGSIGLAALGQFPMLPQARLLGAVGGPGKARDAKLKDEDKLFSTIGKREKEPGRRGPKKSSRKAEGKASRSDRLLATKPD